MSNEQKRHRHNVPGARVLRGRETAAEDLLWEAIRNRRLDGLKFRRQHPIGPLVVDFCCPERRLAVEVDGGVHDTQRDHDAEREELLAVAGYQVIRFANERILHDLPDVLSAIRAAANERQPTYPANAARTAGW